MTHLAGSDFDLTAIQERYTKAWRFHDVDAILALHSEDTRHFAHSGGEPTEGKEALRTTVLETFEQFPEFRLEQRRVLFGSGHWVLEWTLFSGEVEFECVDVVVVTGGLVTSKDTYIDSIQLEATTPRP